mgnify:CR=1 FL=1
MTTTIRISLETRNKLGELSSMAGISMQEVVDRAIELYRRQQLLAAVNHAYTALRVDSVAWSELEAERSDWDATLADGLEPV